MGIAFYYFWGWPIFILRYGFAQGTTLYKDCMATRNKVMPVEFTYPQNGTRNVPLRSLAVIKIKDDGKHIISSGGASYKDGTQMPNTVPMSVSGEYLITGPAFKEGTFDIDPEFPDQLPEVDFTKRMEEINTFVKNAGYDLQKISSFQTEGSWEPNKTVVVQIGSSGCYKPYSFEFTTGTQ
jgi:hypothetical protein